MQAWRSSGWLKRMTKNRRPRVVAVGLHSSQVGSIAPLCGELRPAASLADYLRRYSWTETDVLVAGNIGWEEVDVGVNVLTIGTTNFHWTDKDPYSFRGASAHYVRTGDENTERELTVTPDCPDLYKPLASELCTQLGLATRPPHVIDTSRKGQSKVLITTTSGLSVALRLVLPARARTLDSDPSRPAALLLPSAANLVAWFRAFLSDLHECDPLRVPQAPPGLSQSSDWYTPQERVLADRISRIECDLKRLTDEQDHTKQELATEAEKADSGIRRILWADGDELVAAVEEVFSDLGFAVRNMDAELKQGEPKREDLRLSLQGVPDWQAIVEVKGYTRGTRTNDARQIRDHREYFIQGEGRAPDLTVWLSNPFRTMEDPSSRPTPDLNLIDHAENVGAVLVLAPDLYRQWALVAAGTLDSETVARSLINAEPGLWTPPAPF